MVRADGVGWVTEESWEKDSSSPGTGQITRWGMGFPLTEYLEDEAPLGQVRGQRPCFPEPKVGPKDSPVSCSCELGQIESLSNEILAFGNLSTHYRATEQDSEPRRSKTA